jgi:hypothetical protein
MDPLAVLGACLARTEKHGEFQGALAEAMAFKNGMDVEVEASALRRRERPAPGPQRQMNAGQTREQSRHQTLVH